MKSCAVLFVVLIPIAIGCDTRNPETNVPDATIVSGAAAPPSGHAHPEHIPDSLNIEESDTAVFKK